MPEPAVPTWTIVEKGAFVLGRCQLCGWTSPARRAYASVHREGARHAEVCAGPPEPVQAPAADGAGVSTEN